jgi:enoyl-CoA hydratase
MNEAKVLLTREGGIATLTLNSPANRNALSLELVDELARAVDEIRADEETRVLVLTGAGKAFSSGGDVKSMMAPPGAGLEGMREAIKGYYRKALSFLDLPIPTIASINGHAIGAGCTLALACDLRIASREAKLGLGFLRLGLHPGMGTTYFLPRLVGTARAFELLLTGDVISGKEAEQLGLVNRAVALEELEAATRELALKVAQGPAIAIRMLKTALRQSPLVDLAAALDYEAAAQTSCSQTEDLREGIRAFVEKREPHFTGR